MYTDFLENPLSPSHSLYLTVSELNQNIKNVVEAKLGQIRITGEISNLVKPVSGHVYFTLKDANAQIKVVMWRMTAQKHDLELFNGLKVNILAKVSVFVPRGEYQLVVDNIEVSGEGDLLQAYELLKKQLFAEGLFDDKYKQQILKNPRAIGIITSLTGAALQDVLNVLKRRRTDIPLFIFPTLVQGHLAAPEIIRAIKKANENLELDCLLLVRGGGSIEDLCAFNDKSLAYAIFESCIPIISGIGHEIDFTIADFVCDLRAPTPSAAAELSCVDKNTLLQQIDYCSFQIQNKMKYQIDFQSKQIQSAVQKLNKNHPSFVLNHQKEAVINLHLRIIDGIQRYKNQIEMKLQFKITQFEMLSPLNKVANDNLMRKHNTYRLISAMKQNVEKRVTNLVHLAHSLDLMSPLKTVGRGYGIIKNKQNVTYTSIKQVQLNDILTIMLKDGELSAQVLRVDPTNIID